MDNLPPQNPDTESELIERQEFEKTLAAIMKYIKQLLKLIKGGSEKLNEFLKDKEAVNIEAYLTINQNLTERIQKLNDILLIALLPELMFGNIYLHTLINIIFFEFDNCEQPEYRDPEIMIHLSLLKIRFAAVVLSITTNEDIDKFVFNYFKRAVISAYQMDSRVLPNSLKIQLTDEERKKASEPDDLDPDEDSRSERIAIGMESKTQNYFAESMTGSDPKFIEKSMRDFYSLLQNGLDFLEKDPFLLKSFISFEEDPDLNRLVNEILGIK